MIYLIFSIKRANLLTKPISKLLVFAFCVGLFGCQGTNEPKEKGNSKQEKGETSSLFKK